MTAPNKRTFRQAPDQDTLRRQQEEAKKRLQALDDWTAEPNQLPAHALPTTPEATQAPTSPPEATEAPTLPPATEKPPKAPRKPWEAANGESEGLVSFNFKLPRSMALKLRYLGDTTYGETMTSILIKTLGPRLDKMLQERGLL